MSRSNNNPNLMRKVDAMNKKIESDRRLYVPSSSSDSYDDGMEDMLEQFIDSNRKYNEQLQYNIEQLQYLINTQLKDSVINEVKTVIHPTNTVLTPIDPANRSSQLAEAAEKRLHKTN